MNAVEVRDQVRLPLSKCVELVLSGVRFRIFRAAVTVVIISLAVAFLMTILAEGTTARQVGTAIREETAPRRLFTAWVSRLTVPMKELELSRELYVQSVRLAGSPEGTVATERDRNDAADAARRLSEMQTWGRLDDEQFKTLTDLAGEQFNPVTGVSAFFAALSEGKLRPLVGSDRGIGILERLSDPDHPEHYQQFDEELVRLGITPPIPHSELKAFLARWRQQRPLIRRIIAGHQRAIDQVKDTVFVDTDGKSLDAKIVLAHADESLIESLKSAGFDMTPEELQTVRVQSALAGDADTIERLLGSSFLKGLLARKADIKLAQVGRGELFEVAAEKDGAGWLSDLADKSRGFEPLNMTGDQILRVALSQVPLSHMQLAVDLDAASPDKIAWKSIVAWGELSDGEMRRLVTLALRQDPYTEFFKNLNDKDRKDLLGETTDTNPFGRLLTDEGFDGFLSELKTQSKALPEPTKVAAMQVLEWNIADMKKALATGSDDDATRELQAELTAAQGELAKAQAKAPADLPDKVAVFRRFLSDWKAAAPLRDRVKTGREAALSAVHTVLGIDTIRPLRAQHARKVALLIDLKNQGPEAVAKAWAKQVKDLKETDLPDARKTGNKAEVELLEGCVADRENTITRIQAADTQATIQQVTQEVESLEKQIAERMASAVKAQAEAPALADPVAQQQAADTLAAEKILALLSVPLLREQAALRLRIAPRSIERLTQQALLQELTTLPGAEGWFAPLVKKVSGLKPLPIDTPRVAQVARQSLRQTELEDIVASVSMAAVGSDTGLFAGFSTRMMWLIVVSFVVCIVGIANAMLMSVTERFREIATMKCLGATDGFIMVNFVLESCLQGVVGGVIGAILGFLLGLLTAMGSYGTMAAQHMPWGDLVSMAGISMVVGLGISALAALYPAWAAARLAPMEAMRIE